MMIHSNINMAIGMEYGVRARTKIENHESKCFDEDGCTDLIFPKAMSTSFCDSPRLGL